MKKFIALITLAVLAFTVGMSPSAEAKPKKPHVTVKSVGYDEDGWRYLNLSSGVKHYDEIDRSDGYWDHKLGKAICPAGWDLVYNFDLNNNLWSACM